MATVHQERNARAYCESIRADPDEVVAGRYAERFGHTGAVLLPRWQWYVGAIIQQRAAE